MMPSVDNATAEDVSMHDDPGPSEALDREAPLSIPTRPDQPAAALMASALPAEATVVPQATDTAAEVTDAVEAGAKRQLDALQASEGGTKYARLEEGGEFDARSPTAAVAPRVSLLLTGVSRSSPIVESGGASAATSGGAAAGEGGRAGPSKGNGKAKKPKSEAPSSGGSGGKGARGRGTAKGGGGLGGGDDEATPAGSSAAATKAAGSSGKGSGGGGKAATGGKSSGGKGAEGSSSKSGAAKKEGGATPGPSRATPALRKVQPHTHTHMHVCICRTPYVHTCGAPPVSVPAQDAAARAWQPP